jgi:hypothetical protein
MADSRLRSQAEKAFDLLKHKHSAEAVPLLMDVINTDGTYYDVLKAFPLCPEF